jgi:hypothetical protein
MRRGTRAGPRRSDPHHHRLPACERCRDHRVVRSRRVGFRGRPTMQRVAQRDRPSVPGRAGRAYPSDPIDSANRSYRPYLRSIRPGWSPARPSGRPVRQYRHHHREGHPQPRDLRVETGHIDQHPRHRHRQQGVGGHQELRRGRLHPAQLLAGRRSRLGLSTASRFADSPISRPLREKVPVAAALPGQPLQRTAEPGERLPDPGCPADQQPGGDRQRRPEPPPAPGRSGATSSGPAANSASVGRIRAASANAPAAQPTAPHAGGSRTADLSGAEHRMAAHVH